MGGVLPSPFSIKLRWLDEIPLTESAEKIPKLNKIAIASDKLRGIELIICCCQQSYQMISEIKDAIKDEINAIKD